jgi:hypothetical protein
VCQILQQKNNVGFKYKNYSIIKLENEFDFKILRDRVKKYLKINTIVYLYQNKLNTKTVNNDCFKIILYAH